MRTAVHESGHAVAEELLRDGVEYVSIMTSADGDAERAASTPEGYESIGHTKPARVRDLLSVETDDELMAKLIADLAGPFAVLWRASGRRHS